MCCVMGEMWKMLSILYWSVKSLISRLLERIKRIVGAEEWVKEYEEGDDDSRVCLLLGRRVDVDREVMDVIDRCIMNEMVMWWQRRKVLLGWVN